MQDQAAACHLLAGARRARMPASRCRSGCGGSCAGTRTACRAVGSWRCAALAGLMFSGGTCKDCNRMCHLWQVVNNVRLGVHAIFNTVCVYFCTKACCLVWCSTDVPRVLRSRIITVTSQLSAPHGMQPISCQTMTLQTAPRSFECRSRLCLDRLLLFLHCSIMCSKRSGHNRYHLMTKVVGTVTSECMC
jgi:hypothetical protein